MENNRNIKRAAAIAALAAVAAVLLIMVYAMFTHHSGLLMLSFVCLVIVPVIIYLFITILKIGKH